MSNRRTLLMAVPTKIRKKKHKNKIQFLITKQNKVPHKTLKKLVLLTPKFS